MRKYYYMKMLDKDLQVLFHIVKYCEKIKNATKLFFGNDFQKFLDKKNLYYRDSCSFYVLQIGEIVGRLSEEFRDEHKSIPWKDIKSVRDMIVHDYGNIEFDTLWEIITKDSEELNDFCRSILEQYMPNYEITLQKELEEEI